MSQNNDPLGGGWTEYFYQLMGSKDFVGHELPTVLNCLSCGTPCRHDELDGSGICAPCVSKSPSLSRNQAN